MKNVVLLLEAYCTAPDIMSVESLSSIGIEWDMIDILRLYTLVTFSLLL